MPGSSRRRNASLTGVEEEEEEEEKEEEGHLSFWPKSVCWGGGVTLERHMLSWRADVDNNNERLPYPPLSHLFINNI